ncbi:MAG: hypothetical protein CJBNEKGG_00523 [Prosthecobacter sp.]|nr:hypothetical protein [Prosthecobacter sp.]
MVTENANFGHLTLSRRANGETVRLVRSADELVLLAFDTQIKRLVELHLLKSGQPMESQARKAAIERATAAAGIRGSSFMRILDVGEEEEVVYYTSNLNEGEFALDYVTRRGALPPATAFALLLQLLDDVLLMGDRQRLVPQLMMDRAMVATVEDTFLQLRLFDYGLGHPELPGNDGRHASQVCQLIFLLLTGQAYNGDNPDRYPALTALPMSLRTSLRAALVDPGSASVSIEKLRDDVREAYTSLVSSIHARNSRKQLVLTAALQPRSQLQDLLLEGVPVERVLGSRFTVEDEESARRHPFSIPCLNSKNEQPITVHLLPPSRIVEKTLYDAVPLQSWRFNPDKHPNILRSLSLWESPEWSFLTEEREPGFSLSRLLTERLALNPAEVLVVLRQVQAGIEQALDCGVQRLDLHPSNLFLRVGKNGPTLAREHERLMQKRLDAWPPFHVKLRAHVTMRHLYEPPLAEPPDAGRFDNEHLADKEDRARAFVALAAYLLTGQRQAGGSPVFSEAVPETLAAFMREILEATRAGGLTPSPADMVARFEAAMSAPAMPDLASRLRGSVVPVEEMESAGSVSDFDDDQHFGGDAEVEMPVSPISRRLHAHEFERIPSRGVQKGPVLAAAAVVFGAFLGWLLMPASSLDSGDVAASSPAPSAPVAEPVKKAGAPKIEKTIAATEAASPKAPKVETKPGQAKPAAPAEPAVVTSKRPDPETTITPPVVASIPVKAPERVKMPELPPSAGPVVAMPASKAEPEAAVVKPIKSPEMPVPVVTAPVVASKPGTAPQPAKMQVAPPLPEPVAAVRKPEPEMPAPAVTTPVVASKPEKASEPAKAEVVAPSAGPLMAPTVRKAEPEVAVLHSVKAPETPAPAATVVKAPESPAPRLKTDVPAAASPAPAPPASPVIIRKAIMPTQEEISRFKQGLVEPKPQLPAQVTPSENNPTLPQSPVNGLPQQLGSVPVMKMASPTPNAP